MPFSDHTHGTMLTSGFRSPVVLGVDGFWVRWCGWAERTVLTFDVKSNTTHDRIAGVVYFVQGIIAVFFSLCGTPGTGEKLAILAPGNY